MCYPQNGPLSGAPGHWARCRLVLVTLRSHVQIRCQQVRAAVSGAGKFIDWTGFANYIQDRLEWNTEFPVSYHLNVNEEKPRAAEAISLRPSCLFRRLTVLGSDSLVKIRWTGMGLKSHGARSWTNSIKRSDSCKEGTLKRTRLVLACQTLDTETTLSQNREPLGERLRAAPAADSNPYFLTRERPSRVACLLLPCVFTQLEVEGAPQAEWSMDWRLHERDVKWETSEGSRAF